MSDGCSFASPKTIETTSPDRGRCLLARQDIDAGEVVVVFGGRVIDTATLMSLAERGSHHTLQIDDDHFLLSRITGPGDWVNHSCEPNLGFSGQVVLVAMRPIRAGEELSFDYAMSDGSPYDEFPCRCGQPRCRGQVTGSDWRNPTLWKRYEGYFSPYLGKRIARLRWSDVTEDDTSTSHWH